MRCSCDLRPMPFAGVQVLDHECSVERVSQGKRQDLAAGLRWQEKRVRKKTGALSFVRLDQQFRGAPRAGTSNKRVGAPDVKTIASPSGLQTPEK